MPRLCACLTMCGLMASHALGQTTGQAPAGSAHPPLRSATAVRTFDPPVIDGNLDEAAWRNAVPTGDFVQSEPFEGEPASEATEVRILYDSQAIYVGVTLHDSEPARIVTTETGRDASSLEQDSFKVAFDTFGDKQNGFLFGTNVAGSQWDAQVRGDRPNTSWDASWDVKTQRSAAGWTAEFRIPLRALRYSSPPQHWGVNFGRIIPRRRERVYWAPLPRQFALDRLSMAGELLGLRMETPRNFKVLPYALSSANRNFTPGARLEDDVDIGIDAKVGITPSVNLDLTYNTDFAQVEVDTQQINLTRYNVRFPEKRPFFLENLELFRVGKYNSAATVSSGDVDLFFSRRIGLDDAGNLVPIRGGMRLTGKANGYNIGLLNMQTGEQGANPGNNFTTVRVSRDLRSRSGIGAIFVNRTATGDRALGSDWNRTYGADARLGVGERLTLKGFAARTETPGRRGREYAWNADSEYNDGRTRVDAEYGVTGEDFNPEVGYLDRTRGYRRWYLSFQETLRQETIRSWGFREFLPHVNYTRYTYLDTDRLQNAELHVDNHWDWENGNFIATGLNGSWEGLDQPFEIYPGVVVPPGDHGGLYFLLRSNTDDRKRLSGRHQWDVGRFLTGEQNSQTFGATIRHGGRLILDTTWRHRAIDLPQGQFTTNLGSMRVTYNFTPSVFAQTLIQYNDRTQHWSTNLRFHWLQTAATGLFVVYNDTESLQGLGPVNRAVIVKYVQQIDVLR